MKIWLAVIAALALAIGSNYLLYRGAQAWVRNIVHIEMRAM
jgi:hypothetical protein